MIGNCFAKNSFNPITVTSAQAHWDGTIASLCARRCTMAKVEARVGFNAGPVVFKTHTPARRGIPGASAPFRGFRRGRAPLVGKSEGAKPRQEQQTTNYKYPNNAVISTSLEVSIEMFRLHKMKNHQQKASQKNPPPPRNEFLHTKIPFDKIYLPHAKLSTISCVYQTMYNPCGAFPLFIFCEGVTFHAGAEGIL